METIISIILAILSFFLPAGGADFYQGKAGDEIAVHYIDVGQGDCEFIELPGGKTMLIDAGNKENGKDIIKYIKALDYKRLDYVVATHPHADHIGSMAEVLSEFDTGEIYLPEKAHTSKTFEDMLDVIEEKDISVSAARAGVNILSDGDLSADILAPAGEKYDSLNNYSAVVKITYGESSFLFTGDAEHESEKEMLEKPDLLRADVLKAGHHGSSTSSGEQFIEAVSPQIAVISCGEDNSYGHPHRETLSLFKKRDIEVFRTDECGSTAIIADKAGNYEVVTEE